VENIAALLSTIFSRLPLLEALIEKNGRSGRKRNGCTNGPVEELLVLQHRPPGILDDGDRRFRFQPSHAARPPPLSPLCGPGLFWVLSSRQFQIRG
jgi:hypothetical protein